MRVFTAAFADELVKVAIDELGALSREEGKQRVKKDREAAAARKKAKADAKAKAKADAKATRRAKWTSIDKPTASPTSAKASSPPASIAAPKGKPARRKPPAGGTWKPGDLRSKAQTQWKPGDLRPSASSPPQDAGGRKPKRRGGGRQKLIRGPRPGSVEPIGGTMQGISGKQVARKPLVKTPARTQVAKPQSTGWRPGQPVTAKSLRASVPAGTGRTPPKLLPNRRPNRSYAMMTGRAPMRPAATAQYQPPKPAPAPTFGQSPSFGSAGQLKAPKMSPVATASAMPKAPKPPSFT